MAANERKILTTLSIEDKAFKKAMDDAYRGVKVLSSELKANTAEFATNEKSVDGLTKKSELLGKEITQQKEIVAALTRAVKESEQANGEDSKATDDFRVKLNNAQAALSSMENELEQNNKKLVDAKSKTKALADGLEALSAKMKTAGEAMTKAGKAMSTYVTAPILAAAAAAVKMAADYEEAVNKINTLDLSASSEKIQGISEDMLALSSATGVAASDIGQATYQMASALGSLGDDVVSFVEIATKAAIGGFTDAEVAADGLTTVLNAYGLTTAEEMQIISDQMLTAQNLGKTTFGEIAASVGNVVPIFAQLGGSTEELFSAYAILTKNGIATSQATTGLKAALSNVLKPTAEAANAAKVLGLNFSASEIQSKGFSGFLKELNESIKKAAPEYATLTKKYQEQGIELAKLQAKKASSTKTDKALNDQIKELNAQMKATKTDMEAMAAAADSPISAYSTLFGSVEGLNSMLVLASDQGVEQFNDSMESMSKSAGATEAAYGKMQSGFSASMDKALNSLKNLGLQIGSVIIPKIQPILDWFKEAIEKLAEMDEGTINTILTIAGIAAAVGPVLVVLGKLSTGIAAVSSAISFLIANPIVLGIAAVAAVLGILAVSLTSTSDEMKAFETAANKAANGTDDFGTLVKKIQPNILDINELISSSGNTIGDLKETIDEKSTAINAILTAALNERRVLRDDEIKEISKYNEEIANANDELIELYRSQQLAEFQKVMLEAGDMSIEELEQFSANAKALLGASNEAADDIYSQQLVSLRNQYEAMGKLDSKEYQDALDGAKASHDAMTKENESYYNDTITALTEASLNLANVQATANSDLRKERQKAIDDLIEQYGEWESYTKDHYTNMDYMQSEQAQKELAARETWHNDQLAAIEASRQPEIDAIQAKYDAEYASGQSYFESTGKMGSDYAEKYFTNLVTQREKEIGEIKSKYDAQLQIINDAYDAQYQVIYDKYGRVNELDSAEAQAELARLEQEKEKELTALTAHYDERLQVEIESNAAMTGERISWHDILKKDEEAYITSSEQSWTNYLNKFSGNAETTKQAQSTYAQDFYDYLSSIEYMQDASFLRQYASMKEQNIATTDEMDQHAKDLLATFANVPSDMQDMAMDVLRGESLGLSDPVLRKQIDKEAVGTADDVVNAIIRVWDLGSPSKVANGMGKNFIQGLEDGMNEKEDSVLKTAANIGNLLVQTFKNIFGIHSRSKVMYDQIAGNLMLGWADGIKDKAWMVKDAYSGIVPDTLSSAINLDVTRNFYDIARAASSYERQNRAGETASGRRVISIVQNNTVNANELSYSEQKRINEKNARNLLKELSALNV